MLLCPELHSVLFHVWVDMVSMELEKVTSFSPYSRSTHNVDYIKVLVPTSISDIVLKCE